MSDNDYYKIDKHIAEGTARDNLRTRAAISHGARSDLPIFHRFVVLETIFDPTIVDDAKVTYFEHVLGVINIKFARVLPRNTIVARKIFDSGNTSAVEQAMFLFPFFPPHLSLPCQAGEHVWAMFENPSGKQVDLGYWFCRIVEPGFVEDVNHTHAPRAQDTSFTPSIKDLFNQTADPKYEFRNGVGDTLNGERYTIAETATIPGDEDEYEKLMTQTDAGRLMVYEPVPRFKKRPGDVALEGCNNTLIVLGRDRSGAAASFKIDAQRGKIAENVPPGDDPNPGAGAIDIVAGRGQLDVTGGKEVTNSLEKKEIGKSPQELVENEGDPDFFNDRSRIYIAQRTRVDEKLQLTKFNQEMSSGPFQGQASIGGTERNSVQDSLEGDSAIVIKSDKLRLIARSDVEIIVTGHLERDSRGRIVGSTNTDEFAALVIKANGDIVLRPSKKGYIKLGGDDADKGLVCSDVPVVAANGGISGAPLVTTMGGLFAGSKPQGPDDNGPALAAGQAKFANKILVK